MTAQTYGITDQSVAALVLDAWASLPDMGVPSPAPPLAASSGTAILTAAIVLTGAWNGAVVVRVPNPLATTIASKLFGIPESAVSPADRADIGGELCNVVAGNLKGLIGGRAALSLPIISEQMSHDTASHSGDVTVSLAYAVSGQIFSVQIFEDKARPS